MMQKDEYRGFFDLNITISNDKNIWKTLHDYHVRTVAVNQYLDTAVCEDTKKKKGEKRDDIVPLPTTFILPEVWQFTESFVVIQEYVGEIVVLNRLTIHLSDASLMQKIVQSPNLKLFHIVAVVPSDHQVLQTCCASNDIDLICFEPPSKPRWSISRKSYNVAVQKDIFFEIQYSHVISDSTSRKNTIQMSHTYYTMGKSRNIIITSGTNNVNLLRSHYDVINFCFLLGLNENKAKTAMISNAKQLLKRAAHRRQNKSLLTIINEVNHTEDKSAEMEIEN